MRIAMITETYPPEVNGAGITVRDWVKGLRGLGHQVQLIRPRQPKADGKGPGEVDEFGAEHVLVKGVPLISYPGLRVGLPAKRRLVRLWKADRPDVVHVATEGPLGWSALRAARKLGIPATSSFHTNFHEYAAHYGFRPFARIASGYLKFVHKRSDSVVVATRDIAESVRGLGIKHVGVMPRGVDTERFDPAKRSDALRAGWGAEADTLVVGYVGRLAEEKSLPNTFKVFDAIKAAVPGAQMVVVGDGPIGPKLRDAWPGHTWCGMRRGEDLAAHYASIDLFVFASTTETFGNVVIEAMASGVPLVAYDYAAARLYGRDGENLWLAPMGDLGGLTARAVEAATVPAAQRRAVGAAARAAVAAHAWPLVMRRYEAWLGDVAANGRVTAALPDDGGVAAAAGRHDAGAAVEVEAVSL